MEDRVEPAEALLVSQDCDGTWVTQLQAIADVQAGEAALRVTVRGRSQVGLPRLGLVVVKDRRGVRFPEQR